MHAFLLSLLLLFVPLQDTSPEKPSDLPGAPVAQEEGADSGAQESDSVTAPAEDEGGFRIGVAVNQVFLSVNARSVSGGFVKDLTKENFRVFENGRLQRIVNFYRESVPVKVVLLIDASGSTRYSQTEIRRAALNFVQSLEPEDQVAIITFNHQPKLILNWTSKFEDIELALESIYARGYTVLNDALYVTFDDLLRNVDGKSAVIMLTDGIDTGSMVTFEQAFDLALRSESMVYVVSKLEEYWAAANEQRQQLRAMGRMVPRHLQSEYILEMRGALSKLANLTGGKVLNTRDFFSLTDVYDQVAEELKNQYYLSYVPTNPNRDGSWREIEVEVNRGGVVVSTRRGYFAEGPIMSSN